MVGTKEVVFQEELEKEAEEGDEQREGERGEVVKDQASRGRLEGQEVKGENEEREEGLEGEEEEGAGGEEEGDEEGGVGEAVRQVEGGDVGTVEEQVSVREEVEAAGDREDEEHDRRTLHGLRGVNGAEDVQENRLSNAPRPLCPGPQHTLEATPSVPVPSPFPPA